MYQYVILTKNGTRVRVSTWLFNSALSALEAGQNHISDARDEFVVRVEKVEKL